MYDIGLLNKIKFALMDHSGFTLYHDGTPMDKGYAVGTVTVPTGKTIESLTMRDVPDLGDIETAIAEGKPLCIGGWVDGDGQVWLEPTHVYVPTSVGLYWAQEKAKAKGQIAIYSLHEQKTIYMNKGE